MRTLASALIITVAASACSDAGTADAPGHGGNGSGGVDASVPPGLVALEIRPDTVELDALSSSPVALGAFGRDEAGAETDVTPDAVWSTTPLEVGRLTGSTFFPSGLPGTATVTVRLGGLEATAQVRVRLSAVELVPVAPGQANLPSEPQQVFASAAPSEQDPPSLVYPLDGVLLPRNLGRIDVHYRPGRYQLFEVSFSSPSIDVRFFTRCRPLQDGCVFDLDRELYERIADATAGRGPVEVRVRGTDDEGGLVGSSDPVRVSFSADPVEGGLYYWATNAESIMRVDFGAGNEPERFFPFEDTSTCFGCHALSPDGERMSLSRNGQWNGELYLLDVASGELLLEGEGGNKEQFQSWSPDSSRFAAIYGDDDRPDLHDEIRIRSGETGEILERIRLGHEPTHPDWSAAGDRIAYTRVTRSQTSQRPGRGGIAYVEHDGEAWSEPRDLIEPVDGLNYYNPAHAPDGSFLLFNRSVCPDGQIYASTCDADADPSATLWAIGLDGGEPIFLDRVNAPGPEDDDPSALAQTFPRWAPFVGDRWADGRGRVMWVTFSARRRYGLHPLPEVNKSLPGQLMWMAAIDPEAVLAGDDGSFPAFALPFQDLTTSNHIGQWTQRVVPTDPDPGGPGGDGGTDAGTQCRERGESCEDDPCCPGLACVDEGGELRCRTNL